MFAVAAGLVAATVYTRGDCPPIARTQCSLVAAYSDDRRTAELAART